MALLDTVLKSIFIKIQATLITYLPESVVVPVFVQSFVVIADPETFCYI